MTERIRRMAEYYHLGDSFPKPRTPEYARGDLLLPDFARQAKRTAEYLLFQEVRIDEDDCMVGRLRFDGSVEGDVFRGIGYKNRGVIAGAFYKKPFENLCTFESQHSTADFQIVLEKGLEGRLSDIRASREAHVGDAEALAYLDALETVIHGMLGWAEKCADACAQMALERDEPRKSELMEMARILRKVPAKPAETFREAVQCLYFCWQFLPDSLGLPDRYLYPCYRHDLDAGICDQEKMKELLQELFVMVNAATPVTNVWAGDKGGESHFSLGGFTADGKDGFNDLSRLILEAMMEVPLYRPQVSLRWTPDTPLEVLRLVMDAERRDPFKRIALVNDVPRVRMLTEHVGLPYEQAVRYTMVGCNEPALQGAMYYGGCKTNMVRSLTRTLLESEEECIACKTYDAFFALYKTRFFQDMRRFVEICDGFNAYRAKDVDMLSSVFLFGPVENGKSATRGGCVRAFSGTDLIGLVTVIDSLTVIRQFVYEERRFSMKWLIDMLRSDWDGFEEERREIYRRAQFHGNDEPMTREIAGQVSYMIQEFFQDKRNLYGFKFVIGNQIGYCAHHAWFGLQTPATPDGRHAGDAISFGSGQGGGRDRKGLTALLNSVADMDPACIICGPCVTNVMLDETLIRDDRHFQKTVALVDGYFRKGGMHVQLNYVSREELMEAKREPEKFENLRVRVSGFSGYFTRLDPAIQEEIIARTVKK